MSDLSSFKETGSEELFALQNPHLLRVHMKGDDILARKGSMVAYQGEIKFEHHSAGLSRLAKKALSSDNVSLMHARGSGDLFLAETGMRVHIVETADKAIFVDPAKLLALSSGVEWNLQAQKGASKMYSGGLWQMRLEGSGQVAILSDGEPVLLRCEEGTRVDRQALVAWSGNLQTAIKRDSSMKTWTGRTSGETLQMELRGPGWVLVQPSEGSVVPASSGGFFGSFFDLLMPF